MQNLPIGGLVIDVGSGLGGRAPFWIEQGASRVICIDINDQELSAGRELVANQFPQHTGRIAFCRPERVAENGTADAAILFDMFEHVENPSALLTQCLEWMKPGARLWIGSVGWYNYMASHCLGHIPVPWCQLLFSEKAIITTIQRIVRRSDYVPNFWERHEGLDRWDGVTTLKNRPGEPLNMLSLRRIRQILRASKFEVLSFNVHGFTGKVNRVARFASQLARVPLLEEVFHSYYTAVLRKPLAT